MKWKQHIVICWSSNSRCEDTFSNQCIPSHRLTHPSSLHPSRSVQLNELLNNSLVSLFYFCLKLFDVSSWNEQDLYEAICYPSSYNHQYYSFLFQYSLQNHYWATVQRNSTFCFTLWIDYFRCILKTSLSIIISFINIYCILIHTITKIWRLIFKDSTVYDLHIFIYFTAFQHFSSCSLNSGFHIYGFCRWVLLNPGGDDRQRKR